MSYRDFFTTLQANPPARVYALHGNETYLTTRAAEALKAAVLQGGMEEFNHAVIEGKRLDIPALAETLQALPVMAPGRLVEVRDCPLLTLGKAKEDEGTERGNTKELFALFSMIPDTTTLLLRYGEGVRFAAKAKTALQDAGAIIWEFEPLAEQEALPILRRFAKDNGGAFAAGADRFLLQYTAADLTMLEHEVEKLASAAQDGVITQALVRELCEESVEWKVFSMLDDVFAGKRGPALRALGAMLDGGEACGSIISLVDRQLRLMWLAKGMGKQEAAGLARTLKERPYPVELAARQSAKFSPEAIQAAIQQCAQTDYAIKSGRMEDRRATELLVIAMLEMAEAAQGNISAG